MKQFRLKFDRSKIPISGGFIAKKANPLFNFLLIQLSFRIENIILIHALYHVSVHVSGVKTAFEIGKYFIKIPCLIIAQMNRENEKQFVV